MARPIITSEGAVAYRTTNMPLARAAAFARCVTANTTRFCDVAIVQARTKEVAYHVTFRPVSVLRQGDLYEAQWAARCAKAASEGADYIYWRDDDCPGSWWVFNPISGETYTVCVFSCSCPDYHYRAGRAGVACKHMQALGHQTEKVTETREARNARIQAGVSKDFG